MLILEDNGIELVPDSVTDNDDGTCTVVTGELGDGAHALTPGSVTTPGISPTPAP